MLFETEDERVFLAAWRGEVVDPSIIAERGWDGYIGKAPNIIGERVVEICGWRWDHNWGFINALFLWGLRFSVAGGSFEG